MRRDATALYALCALIIVSVAVARCPFAGSYAGVADSKDDQLSRFTRDPGDILTSNQGGVISDDDNSLKAGARGPGLLEDFFLREKITHFDHERIPERVVHARGSGFHGSFQVYQDMSDLTKAKFLSDPKKSTPVFVRFSTVVGSRGSPDTPRDVRGFAVKFYTEEGVYDLVGNNIPVFFIQDAIKFPDLVHAVKPEPNNEVPQAASAHDTFWDFAAATPESTHMLMWVMSDRALPRSFTMMEGFGVHTFRFVNQAGKARFVKFHWKPVGQAVNSLTWDEAQKIGGKDIDFNRRELWELIESGVFPEWEFGIQVVEEEDADRLLFDLFDATKIIPEELVPVQRIGKMVLNRNVDNFFAETEQVAFCPAHLVPGIDLTEDPLLQGRLFSYLDTQISRLGVNFAEIPINQPINDVRNNYRDGKMKFFIPKGQTAHQPNPMAGNKPAPSPKTGYVSYPVPVTGTKLRARSPTFADHFTQATLFWNSMSWWEKKHIIAAFSFELNMCSASIRERVVNGLLANVNTTLAKQVGQTVGVQVQPQNIPTDIGASPILSQDKVAPSIMGRRIAILLANGVDQSQLDKLQASLIAEKAMVLIVAPYVEVLDTKNKVVPVIQVMPNAAPELFDAVIVADGADSVRELNKTGKAVNFVASCYFHGKPVAALGEGVGLLRKSGITRFTPEEGVLTNVNTMAADLIAALKKHRFFNRDTEHIPV